MARIARVVVPTSLDTLLQRLHGETSTAVGSGNYVSRAKERPGSCARTESRGLQSHIVVIQDATRQLLRFRSFAFRVSLVIPVVEVLLARVIQV
jgi:hypothetical protein